MENAINLIKTIDFILSGDTFTGEISIAGVDKIKYEDLFIIKAYAVAYMNGNILELSIPTCQIKEILVKFRINTKEGECGAHN